MVSPFNSLSVLFDGVFLLSAIANFSFYNHYQVTTRENSQLDSLGNDHGA